MIRKTIIIAVLAAFTFAGLESCTKEKKNPWYNPEEEEEEEPEVKGDTVLYNGIELPSVWPPKSYVISSNEPMNCFWLDKGHPDVVPIDLGRQLFVDDFLIQSTTLERKFYKAVKYSNNPILKAANSIEIPNSGFPGAGPKDGGIWWDPQESKFKMWYEAGWLNTMAYATSTDGINWVKPSLGGTDNQIPSLASYVPNSCAVVLDNDATDGYRFKMFFRPPNQNSPNMTGYAMMSKDGITWSSPVVTGYCGDRSTMFYNPFRKKWVFSIRSEEQLGSTSYGRARYYVEGDDFLQTAGWKLPSTGNSDVVFWCRATKYDLQDPTLKMTPQLYNVNAVAYESIMLGWHQILVDENNPAKNAGRPKVTDLKLAFSRDGFNWYRPYNEAIIPSTRTAGTWDRGYVQSVGGICAIMGDQLWFWYIGFAGVDNRPGHSASLHSNMATGIAYMRRDGFASMSGSGTLTTVPVKFTGKYLFVNINCPYGDFAAEILDEKGDVISDFSKDKCKVLNVNSTIAQVEWTSGKDLSSLKDKTVKLRFYQNSGDFYSFWISPSTNGESNGYVAGGGPGFTASTDTQGKNAYGKTIVIN